MSPIIWAALLPVALILVIAIIVGLRERRLARARKLRAKPIQLVEQVQWDHLKNR